jgi:hypothetical protein
MTEQLSNQAGGAGEPRSQSMSLVRLLAVVGLLSFGLTMLGFSLLYVRDLQTLSELPDMIWAFICGVPSENGVVLPLLILMSTVSIFIAAALWGWHWLHKGSPRPS